MAGDEKLRNRAIESTHLMVCEGADEYDLLVMLRKERGWGEEQVEIVNADGRDKLETKLVDALKQSGRPGITITHVGLIFDSEEDPEKSQRWAAELARKFQLQGLQIQLFQLPGSTQAGSLETLIRRHISTASAGFACATQWEACVQLDAETSFDLQAKRDKAWLQVWLTHRTASTASRIGYALAKDKDLDKKLRRELDACLQPLLAILDSFVGP